MMPTARALANVVDQLDGIDMADSDNHVGAFESHEAGVTGRRRLDFLCSALRMVEPDHSRPLENKNEE